MKNINFIKKVPLFVSIFTTTLLYLSKNVYSQTDISTVIPSSPEVSSLFQFLDYPMDYSTGLPQITIPIYEIKTSELTLPISISYHASGRKIYDRDGPVSLGWSLKAGGMISRIIYGSPDFGTLSTGTYEFPYPFKYQADLYGINIDNLKYFEKIMHFDKTEGDILPGDFLDSEYDIFSYYFNNHSGKFIFKDSNSIKIPLLLPYKPYRITPTYSSTGLSKIDITDDKGLLYEFIIGETYSASNSNATSSWVLSKIISADKTDTISFKYTLFNQEKITISQQATLIDKWTIDNEPYPVDDLAYTEHTNHEYYNISRLTEIDFKQGRILFNLDGGEYEIENIQIINNKNTVLKTIQFNRSICDHLAELGYVTHKLDELVFKDKNGLAKETYSFEYYPSASSDGEIDARYSDWWGYYNASGVHDFVPYYPSVEYVGPGGNNSIPVGNSSADRGPNLNALKSGVLKKITYPTGGSTEFIYENNKCTLYGSQTSVIKGPGLRVKQIITSDDNGGSQIKTFKYGVNECGYGAIELLPDQEVMSTEVTYNYIGSLGYNNFTPNRAGSYRQRTFYSNFLPEVSVLANRPVIYPEVTEYYGTPTNNTGKTIYKYDYSPWALSGMPQSQGISKMHIYNYNYWNNPSLTSKIDYKSVTNAGGIFYKKIMEIKNDYTAVTTDYIKGLHVRRLLAFPQTGRDVSTGYYAEEYATAFYSKPIYAFGDYQIPVGYKSLSATTKIIYDDNSSIENRSSYTYNSRQLVSQETHTASNGSSKITRIKYPFDFPGSSILNQMTNLNMLNFPVEKSNFKNDIFLNSTKTNYHNWGSGVAMMAPQTIETKVLDNDYETRIHYYEYDNGKPISMAKENDFIHSYIWDYNKTYPIAEAINASQSDIAYSSFEANGKGTWSFSGTPTSAAGGITGTMAYSLNSGSIDRSGLTSTHKYIVSYWLKSGGNVNIADGSRSNSLTGKTVNGWTYHEVTITGTLNISISGSGYIDELRLYPLGARMTTYTYEPLIGMTSVCNMDNTIQYYEYDDMGRLRDIMDEDLNIVKTFKYHSKQ